MGRRKLLVLVTFWTERIASAASTHHERMQEGRRNVPLAV